MRQRISDFAGTHFLPVTAVFLSRPSNWFGFFIKSKVLSKGIPLLSMG